MKIEYNWTSSDASGSDVSVWVSQEWTQRRSSLADELQWKVWENSYKVGIKRHVGRYQLKDRGHATIAKSSGYHGNRWNVDADNLELGTRRLTRCAVDEAVMKERDIQCRNEQKLQRQAAKLLYSLNKEFLRIVRTSQKNFDEMFQEERKNFFDHYESVLEELNHYNDALNVDKLADEERERRVRLVQQVTSAHKSASVEAYLKDLAATNDKMNVVRADLVQARKKLKGEVKEAKSEEKDVMYDLKDQAMRELKWKAEQKRLKLEISQSHEAMIQERSTIDNDKCMMSQFRQLQLVMKELKYAFKKTKRYEKIEKEKKILKLRIAKERLMEELMFKLNRCNAAKMCASEKTRRIYLAEVQRFDHPDEAMRKMFLGLHEEMILDYFGGLRLPISNKNELPHLPTDHDNTLYLVRSRARLKTNVVARRKAPLVED